MHKFKKDEHLTKDTDQQLREDMKDLLAEYFAGGVDEDEELALSLGLEFEDIRRMREEYER